MHIKHYDCIKQSPAFIPWQLFMAHNASANFSPPTYLRQTTVLADEYVDLETTIALDDSLKYSASKASNRVSDSWHQTDIQNAQQSVTLQHSFARISLETKPKIQPLPFSEGVKYPQNKFEWLMAAEKKVSEINPRLILLLDLDRTMFVSFKNYFRLTKFLEYKTRFTQKDTITVECPDKTSTLHVAVDTEAMRAVSEFQLRGHSVVVVTSGKYSFTQTKHFFSCYKITLDSDLFFNTFDMQQHSKPSFINEILQAKNNCLLIDDVEKHCPQNAFFSKASCDFFILASKENAYD